MGMLAIKLLTGEDYWRSTAVNDIIADVEKRNRSKGLGRLKGKKKGKKRR